MLMRGVSEVTALICGSAGGGGTSRGGRGRRDGTPEPSLARERAAPYHLCRR